MKIERVDKVKYSPEDLAILQDFKKAIQKKQKEVKKVNADIENLRQEIIAKYCPHKVGDKVILVNGLNQELTAYCVRISYYTFQNPMQFRYEFSAKYEAGKYNPAINYVRKYKWI